MGVKLCISAGVGGGFCQEVQSVMLPCVAVSESVGVVNHPELCRICSACAVPSWSHLLLAGLARQALQQEVLPELGIPSGKSWLSWECGREVSREFLLRTCLPVIPTVLERFGPKSPLVLQSCLCSSQGAGGWQWLCAASPPEGQCVCGSGLACFSTKWKKWVYSCLIKQETNVAPVQRGWITYFMNRISITMLCFVQEVICIYGSIFQQDKYDIRQDFPEVNSVNNKRLCQGKLRNDLILTHLYCNAKMPLTKL